MYSNNNDMESAKLTLPRMKTKTVWCGTYGGHYNQIVFFSKKPVASTEEHNHISGVWYDCLDNKEIIVGDMGYEEFMELYPTANIPYPTDIEVVVLTQIKITTIWEEWKQNGRARFKMRSILGQSDW